MAWLRSPKQLIKFTAILVLVGLGLFIFSHNVYPTQSTALSDAKSDEDVLIDLEQNRKKVFNTTWDEGKGICDYF